MSQFFLAKNVPAITHLGENSIVFSLHLLFNMQKEHSCHSDF